MFSNQSHVARSAIAVACLVCTGALGASQAIQRDGWSFNRASLQNYEQTGPLTERKGPINGSGWADYDFDAKQGGWYELWFKGMPTDWVRDVYLDGRELFRQSLATADDSDHDWAKEGNLFLSEGKHTLRIRRLAPPGKLPNAWELRPAEGRPEASITVAGVKDTIVSPGKPFELRLLGGSPAGALNYTISLKSLLDDSEKQVATVEFPAAASPTERSVTIGSVAPGAYTLRATCDGKPLKPNDLKALTLVVSKAVERPVAAVPTALNVSGLFSAGMVVPHDVPLPIWGTAVPGDEVKVDIAGQSQSAKADDAGNWQVTLAPIPLGPPLTLRVSDGKKKIELGDILAGEVWLLSGQSNMGGRLRENTGGDEAARNEAKYPDVRLGWASQRQGATSTATGLMTMWQPAAVTPTQPLDKLETWNSIAFAFGTELHRKLNVPIGMVINNRGGTFISAWTSRAAQDADPSFKANIDRWEDDSHDNGIHLKVSQQIPSMLRAAHKNAKNAAATAVAMPAKIDLDSMIASKIGDLSRNAPAEQFDALTQPLAPFPFKGVVWYQGESDVNLAYCYTSSLKTFINDWRKTFANESLPFVVVQIAYGDGKPYAGDPADSRLGEMQEAQQKILEVPHTSLATTYDLPRPTDNVHYLDKLPVGRRAALAALHNVYGEEDVVGSGPVYQSMKADGHEIRLTFTHTDGGLKAKGDKLGGFSIAGADQKFYWADARIEGDAVVVSSDKVPSPVAVRYGWANAPCGANLYNSAGLPAVIFRTDDWPLSTKAVADALK